VSSSPSGRAAASSASVWAAYTPADTVFAQKPHSRIYAGLAVKSWHLLPCCTLLTCGIGQKHHAVSRGHCQHLASIAVRICCQLTLRCEAHGSVAHKEHSVSFSYVRIRALRIQPRRHGSAARSTENYTSNSITAARTGCNRKFWQAGGEGANRHRAPFGFTTGGNPTVCCVICARSSHTLALHFDPLTSLNVQRFCRNQTAITT